MTAPPCDGLPRRRALVTGAGRNIGRATALQLAGQGFDVVVHTRRDEVAAAAVVSEVESFGVRGDVVLADLADPDAVRRMADGLGRIDVLINNAAIRPLRPFLEIDASEWRSVLAVTLDAAYVLAQAVLPGMQERRWGRIVSMTGVRSHMGAPGRASSSAAKHALVGLTRSLANEFGGFGITANLVCPGTVMTDEDAAAGTPAGDGGHRGGALGRRGRPEEIAAVVGFLVSDLGGYVTGQTVGANGGELMI